MALLSLVTSALSEQMLVFPIFEAVPSTTPSNVFLSSLRTEISRGIMKTDGGISKVDFNKD